VAVGAWAAIKGGRATWLLPASFVGAMLVGGALGGAGLAVPLVEPSIAGSVVILGLVIAADLRLAGGFAMALVALFGLAHGHAHGTEMPLDGNGLLYGLGFTAATVTLHLAGIAAGTLATREFARPALRVGGAATAALGILLLAG
jgi:urease accessory protein